MSVAIKRPHIAIIFYTTYGHVHTLAQTIKKGIESTGATASIYQVAETLPENVLKMIHAPAKPDVPIATLEHLTSADGILFGSPTRFGMIASQLKSFLDSTGGLWYSNALHGKPAGLFFSTAGQGGGQETTALTAVTQLAHHGMVYVPIGYGEKALNNSTEIHGGSAYGTGTIAGSDGSRQPSEVELTIATYQGKYFAEVVTAMKTGYSAMGKQ